MCPSGFLADFLRLRFGESTTMSPPCTSAEPSTCEVESPWRKGEGRRVVEDEAPAERERERDARVGQDVSDTERRRTLGMPGPVHEVGAAGLNSGAPVDESMTVSVIESVHARLRERLPLRGGLLSVARAASNGDGGTLTCETERAMGDAAARLTGVGRSHRPHELGGAVEGGVRASRAEREGGALASPWLSTPRTSSHLMATSVDVPGDGGQNDCMVDTGGGVNEIGARAADRDAEDVNGRSSTKASGGRTWPAPRGASLQEEVVQSNGVSFGALLECVDEAEKERVQRTS